MIAVIACADPARPRRPRPGCAEPSARTIAAVASGRFACDRARPAAARRRPGRPAISPVGGRSQQSARRAPRPGRRSPRAAAAPCSRSTGRRCRARRRPRRATSRICTASNPPLSASASVASSTRRRRAAWLRASAPSSAADSSPRPRHAQNENRFPFRGQAAGHRGVGRFAGMADVLETADRLFTGDARPGGPPSVQPVRRAGRDLARRPRSSPRSRTWPRSRTDDGLVVVDTSSPFLCRRVHDALRTLARRPARHRGLHPRPHRPLLRRRALRGRGRRARLARRRGSSRTRRSPTGSTATSRPPGTTASSTSASSSTAEPFWPTEYRYPDETYRDRLDLDVGGERFELHHARGETDDHTWVWVPDRRVLCTGDLFIWASPNCGNPQKVQRYAIEWARALRAMAALGAEVLLPGHGLPDRRRRPGPRRAHRLGRGCSSTCTPRRSG